MGQIEFRAVATKCLTDDITFALKRNSKGQIPISKIKSNDRAYINKAEITD